MIALWPIIEKAVLMSTSTRKRLLCIAAGPMLLLFLANRAYSAETPALLGAISGPDYLVSIDRATAFGTRIGHLGINFNDAMTALEYDSVHHVLYGATSGSVPDLFTVNPSSGLATRVGAPGTLGVLLTGMAYDPVNDILYASGGDRTFRKNLYEINRATGSSTLLGTVAGISDSIQGLGFDPQTSTLYGLDEFASTGARVVAIDTATLTATALTVNINPAQDGWNGLAFDPFTHNLFVSSNTLLYRIDPNTKSISTVGLMYSPQLHTHGSLTVMASYIVPEPAALALFLIGLPLIFLQRRAYSSNLLSCRATR